MTRSTNMEHVEVLRELEQDGDAGLTEREREAIRQVIASLSSPKPEGEWVLVPREASSEMLTAAIDAHLGFEGEDEVDAVWAAMLSAAEQFGATAGHAAPDVGNGAEGGSRAPTRPAHFPGMFPRQDDPASSSLSHQAVDVGQFRPAVATHQLACRRRVRDCREGLLPTDNLPIYLKELAEANRLLDVVDRAAPQPLAEAQPVACDEDRFEQFLQAAIARSPEPLRELGEYLAGVLDDDQWPAADRLLLQLATSTPSAPVGVEGHYHPCTSILIEGLKRLEGGSDVLEEWDRARVKVDTALAQQPAADNRICSVCDGGPGNDGPCLCGERRWEQPAAVDDAMVARAWEAAMEIKHNKDPWFPMTKRRMKRALAAALAAQSRGSDNDR